MSLKWAVWANKNKVYTFTHENPHTIHTPHNSKLMHSKTAEIIIVFPNKSICQIYDVCCIMEKIYSVLDPEYLLTLGIV